MRFKERGTDIPDELIRDVEAGNVVFLCGAGVSLRVGLPDFKRLTEQVYELLGEASDGEPAERIALERKEFDRALRSLEKRTHLPRTESRVRAAVAKLLATPSKTFLDHQALLSLSKDPEGRPRILTTNFDILFERAAVQAGMLPVPSYAGKAIPQAGAEGDFGIFHLHGRIGDSELALPRTDFVLTSADFGDAYLRDGWVSRYIEDRMRLGALVLVGYSAEDAAMRLLLETLDADRARFKDLKDIYAIETGTDCSTSIWKAKGIKPIEFVDYEAIYETLAEWAIYNRNPDEYRACRIQKIVGAPSKSASQ